MTSELQIALYIFGFFLMFLSICINVLLKMFFPVDTDELNVGDSFLLAWLALWGHPTTHAESDSMVVASCTHAPGSIHVRLNLARAPLQEDVKRTMRDRKRMSRRRDKRDRLKMGLQISIPGFEDVKIKPKLEDMSDDEGDGNSSGDDDPDPETKW